MIRNNLASLLAERSIKITKVATDTDLSRNTITSTAQNDGKMIQLETINILCKYLEISPAEFFSFLPFDLEFSVYKSDDFRFERLSGGIRKPVGLSFDCYLKVIYKDRTKTFDIPVYLDGSDLYFAKYNVDTDDYDTYIHFLFGSENDDFYTFWNDIPAGFKSDLTRMMERKVIDSFEETIRQFSEPGTENLEAFFISISFHTTFEFIDPSEFKQEFYGNKPADTLIAENEMHSFDNISPDDLPF